MDGCVHVGVLAVNGVSLGCCSERTVRWEQSWNCCPIACCTLQVAPHTYICILHTQPNASNRARLYTYMAPPSTSQAPRDASWLDNNEHLSNFSINNVSTHCLIQNVVWTERVSNPF